MKNNKRRPGRPKMGKEKRQTCSIRIEPLKRAQIIEEFGSLQAFFDSMVDGFTEKPDPSHNFIDDLF